MLLPHAAEYCGKGSLTDVLKGGLASPQRAAQLTWSRRLAMVSACGCHAHAYRTRHKCTSRGVELPPPCVPSLLPLQALDAGKGMLYLHKQGFVHRDLKSPNLLVESTWRVKVCGE